MSESLSFDVLEFLEELKKSGMKVPEAEAITRATSNAFIHLLQNKEIVTIKDVLQLKIEMQAFIVKVIVTAIMILGSLQTVLHFFK